MVIKLMVDMKNIFVCKSFGKMFYGLLFLALSCQAAYAGKAFIWQIKSQTSTVYLLGSIHFADQDFYPLDPVIEKAFAESDQLVLEINPLTVDQQQVQGLIRKKGFYHGDETIREHVDKQVLTMLDSFLEQHNLPVSPDFMKMRPGMMALTLTAGQLMQLGYQPEYGMDLYFAKMADSRKKPILALETVQGQLAKLFSIRDDNEFLRYTLLELENLESDLKQIITAWENGDPQHLHRLLIEPYENVESFKQFTKKLIDHRNLEMTAKIRKYLKSGQTSLVVVGAAHLVGEKGILNLIKNSRYTIVQLENEESSGSEPIETR